MSEIKATKTFNLLSGVECEVFELTGKQQHILSEQDGKDGNDKFVKMLATIIKRVGSVENPDEKFITSMLSGDRKKALVMARQFSMRDMDQEKKFLFHYPYTDKNGIKQNHELEINLENGFPEKVYKKADGSPLDCKEYSEINREYETILPRTKKRVTFKLVDGYGESIGSAVKKKSSHTTFIMHNCRYYVGDTPIQLDEKELDNLPMSDIEHLRKVIFDVEGAIDTVVEFEHPEADIKPKNEKIVRTDLLTQTAFFFPSEAI